MPMRDADGEPHEDAAENQRKCCRQAVEDQLRDRLLIAVGEAEIALQSLAEEAQILLVDRPVEPEIAADLDELRSVALSPATMRAGSPGATKNRKKTNTLSTKAPARRKPLARRGSGSWRRLPLGGRARAVLLGSSASRSPSPRMLKASVVSEQRGAGDQHQPPGDQVERVGGRFGEHRRPSSAPAGRCPCRGRTASPRRRSSPGSSSSCRR